MSIRIAKAKPFEGCAKILAPSVVGVSVGKPFIYRIPAIGARPLSISAAALPEGVTLSGSILSGCIHAKGDTSVLLRAVNAEGECEKELILSCDTDNMLQTPLLGFTTWNAFAHRVTQADMERTARQLVEMGLADYGYTYVNLDSGWQKEYGGKFDAIQPNDKFPDMKGMYDYIHSLGLRGGIYSTPMITAWGCPEGLASIPGCTRGEPDFLNTNEMGGIGKEHLEANNVRQWEEWGVDYLKYDWRPTDPATAHPMKQALLASRREIAFCVTVNALEQYGHYWSKHCTSWRDNRDSIDKWHVVRQIFDSVRKNWKRYVRRGHFFDLDMLEIGHMHWNKGNRGLTENEELFAYSMRAFFLSPLQISCRLENLTEYELNMLCNEEVLAIHQDALCDFPELLHIEDPVRIYRRRLENGDIAYALFNMTRETVCETIEIGACSCVRNAWAKENLPCTSNISIEIEPHGAYILRVTPA